MGNVKSPLILFTFPKIQLRDINYSFLSNRIAVFLYRIVLIKLFIRRILRKGHYTFFQNLFKSKLLKNRMNKKETENHLFIIKEKQRKTILNQIKAKQTISNEELSARIEVNNQQNTAFVFFMLILLWLFYASFFVIVHWNEDLFRNEFYLLKNQFRQVSVAIRYFSLRNEGEEWTGMREELKATYIELLGRPITKSQLTDLKQQITLPENNTFPLKNHLSFFDSLLYVRQLIDEEIPNPSIVRDTLLREMSLIDLKSPLFKSLYKRYGYIFYVQITVSTFIFIISVFLIYKFLIGIKNIKTCYSFLFNISFSNEELDLIDSYAEREEILDGLLFKKLGPNENLEGFQKPKTVIFRDYVSESVVFYCIITILFFLLSFSMFLVHYHLKGSVIRAFVLKNSLIELERKLIVSYLNVETNVSPFDINKGLLGESGEFEADPILKEWLTESSNIEKRLCDVLQECSLLKDNEIINISFIEGLKAIAQKATLSESSPSMYTIFCYLTKSIDRLVTKISEEQLKINNRNNFRIEMIALSLIFVTSILILLIFWLFKVKIIDSWRKAIPQLEFINKDLLKTNTKFLLFLKGKTI